MIRNNSQLQTKVLLFGCKSSLLPNKMDGSFFYSSYQLVFISYIALKHKEVNLCNHTEFVKPP